MSLVFLVYLECVMKFLMRKVVYIGHDFMQLSHLIVKSYHSFHFDLPNYGEFLSMSICLTTTARNITTR